MMYGWVSLPTVGEFLFTSQADVLDQDTISRLKCSTAPDFEVVVPLMLGCTLFGCFLGYLVGEVEPLSELSGILCLIGSGRSVRRQTKKGIDRQSWVSAKHKKEWRISSGLMEGCIVCVYQRWHMSLPVRRLVFFHCTQHFQERLVKAFALSVPHRMVGCCSGLFYPSDSTQFTDQVRLKRLPLITVNPRWESIVDGTIKLSNNTLAVVRAVWFFVGMACV